MKCDVCGNQSDFEAGFIDGRKSFALSRRTLCVRCWMQRNRKVNGWYQIAIVVGGVIGYFLLCLDPESALGNFLSALFFLNLFLVLSIIPHELAHAAVARLVGWRVFQIIIGVGKCVEKFRLFNIGFEIHMLPIGGITRTAPVNGEWLRLKRFLVVLAGPAVNALMAAVVYLIWWDDWKDQHVEGIAFAMQWLFISNILVVAVNLWPFQVKIYNTGSDGKQLLKCIFPDKTEIQDLQAGRFALEAEFCRQENDLAGAREWCDRGLSGFPDNSHIQNMKAILCLDDQDYAQARQIFKTLLDRETKPGLMRYVLMNNVAYTDALIADPQLLAEADDLSKQAFGAMSSQAPIIGTRGTVLLMRGDLREAIELLSEAFEEAGVPRNKAENACFLAIAYARSGNVKKGKQFLDLARQFQSDCPLIARAEKELNKESLLPPVIR